LVCRMTTTMTQMKKITLTTVMMKMGARNAPTRAPICDRKQLQGLFVCDINTHQNLISKSSNPRCITILALYEKLRIVILLRYSIIHVSSLYDDVTLNISAICHIHNEGNKYEYNG
jgi:hypothetical protein